MSAYLETLVNGSYIKPVFSSLEDCFEQGGCAADQCYKRDQNPYPEGAARREWWDAGHSGSMDELTGT